MIFIYLFIALYFLAMLFIFLFSLAQAHLLIHFFLYRKKTVPRHHSAMEDLPLVTVQLPIYNERYVVERLLEAVAALNYPPAKLEIQVLDDSTDKTQELILRKIKEFPDLNFNYLHRTERSGFKAGALREGLAHAIGEFVAVFDADFVPDPDFLRDTLPFFSDPHIGMVQSRWTHLNRDYSILTRLQALALDAHFLVEQVGRNRQQAFINFNGTGGIWRARCIREAGNWQDDTLTEDLDLSYRAQQQGWHFVYRPEIHSPAELPPVMSAIKSQQYRWTKGGAECAVKHLKNVWEKPMPFRVKFHAIAHLLNSLVFIAIFLAAVSSVPLWWAYQREMVDPSIFRVGVVFLLGFAVIASVYIVAYFYGKKKSAGNLLGLIWQLPLFLAVSMGLSLHNSRAVWQGLRGKRTSFVRTPKFNLENKSNFWANNRYISRDIPLITCVEGGLFVFFLLVAATAVYHGTYAFLPFHLLLATGYGMVFFTTYRSYRL